MGCVDVVLLVCSVHILKSTVFGRFGDALSPSSPGIRGYKQTAKSLKLCIMDSMMIYLQAPKLYIYIIYPRLNHQLG